MTTLHDPLAAAEALRRACANHGDSDLVSVPRWAAYAGSVALLDHATEDERFDAAVSAALAERDKEDDVAAIEVDKPDTKGRTCTISIRLHSGQIFRSPTRHDENGARAVRAEIIRRLSVPPDAGPGG